VRGRLVNVAATCASTTALGPGLRAVVWVQGCPFRCAGCIAPDWIPQQAARWVAPANLVDELLADPDVTGLTFSGGEPMAQADGLAQVVRCARSRRDLTLICFTGYRLAELRAKIDWPGVADLLAEIDVLIDGRYVAARNDNRGLRGSSNQKIHYLTGRLASTELTTGPRRSEIRLRARSALLVGVPDVAAAVAFAQLPDWGHEQ
jgi:anaerobic ribonucleoside-triphosphate reductase activating protein